MIIHLIPCKLLSKIRFYQFVRQALSNVQFVKLAFFKFVLWKLMPLKSKPLKSIPDKLKPWNLKEPEPITIYIINYQMDLII
jgi:hypothetical protein